MATDARSGKASGHGSADQVLVAAQNAATSAEWKAVSLISTIATFARATDITVSELSIESFYPTDTATVEALRAFAATRSAA